MQLLILTEQQRRGYPLKKGKGVDMYKDSRRKENKSL